MTRLAYLALAACVHLAHVEPQPRAVAEANAATVRVDVTCYGDDPWVALTPHARGTGVIVSGRHVLTAAHLVRCPTVPVVRITRTDGWTLRMYVERDDAMFGGGADIARLELASADTLGPFAPPVLAAAAPGAYVYAATRRVFPHGIVNAAPSLVGMVTIPGDSGAAVYDSAGRLVGLVVADVERSDGSRVTRIAPVPPSMLEGT